MHLTGMYQPHLLAAFDPMIWLSNAIYLLKALLGFSLVIFVHELGHFLAAKWAGVNVEKFCIGFGKELFGFTRGGTRYGWNILPLGGYVKMLGQEDFVVDKSGELKVKDQPGSFTSKTIAQRMVIVSAGVIMNLIFAAIGLSIYMMVGYDTQPPVVGVVVPASPAARAGLVPGDRIAAVNGKSVSDYEELRTRIALSDPDEVLELDVMRDGKLLLPKPRVIPRFNESERVRQLGISFGTNRFVSVTDSLNETPRENELNPKDRIDGFYVSPTELRPVRGFGDLYAALIAARGRPVDLSVLRPDHPPEGRDLLKPDPNDLPGRKVRVTSRARWYLQGEDPAKPDTASLLGLVPRIVAANMAADSPAARAGVKPLDVIVSYNGHDNVARSEFFSLVAETQDQECALIVRRPRGSCGALSADAVALVAARREAWLDAAIRDPAAAREMIDADLRAVASASATGQATTSASAPGADPGVGVTAADASAIRAAAARAATPNDWLTWLESVDQVRLQVKPTKPFTLTGGAKPQIGLVLDPPLPEDDRLVVANVLPEINGHPSPAARATVPRGAVLLAVDGQPVTTWADLTEAFRAHAGSSVKLRYRLGVDYRETDFSVPPDMAVALGLPVDAQIQEINGQSQINVVTPGGESRSLFLPDWQAVRELLKTNVGKTVTVEYLLSNGESRQAGFDVTADNIDPWSLRVAYSPQFFCYPLIEHVRVTNPIEAMIKGVEKTYLFTWSTVQSIRHIVFTRQVGVDKVSGPVGIAAAGMQAAEMGWMRLLFLMCLISANLAVINFLPLPIVDGGLFLFLVLEKIRGEPVSLKVQTATQLIGIALIASIFLFVTAQDILNLLR